MKSITLMLLLFFSLNNWAQTNEKLKIDFEQGKAKMLKENIALMAEYYNVDISEAELIQAKLWDNPTFVWNAEMYSIAQNSYFRFANQKLIQLEYVFSVSGVKINTIREAKIGKELATHALSDVIRSLVLDYSIAYYDFASLMETNNLLNQSLGQYDKLIERCAKGKELGINSESELIRLKSERQSILNEINSNLRSALESEHKLKMLMHLPLTVSLEVTTDPNPLIPNLKEEQLAELSIANRPDFMIAKTNIEFYKANLKKQKSKAVPNVKLGYQPLDGGSNFVRPYSGMVFEMGIPIFNRNQGDIAAAKIKIDQNKLLLEYKTDEIKSEVNTAYQTLQKAIELRASFNSEITSDMEKLSENARVNFEKKNINLYEYIDYQRSYLEYKMNLIQATRNYYDAINQLNFAIGADIKKL
ncbi:MAG: TolC family protein [Flavobacteriales bacterium]|nr:TolC family protein [Flavobacteriales bacterium]